MKMKFFSKFIFNTALGVSVTITLNSGCKADGG